MSKIIILQGLPASGKSTKAKEMCSKAGWKRVNKDDLRAMLTNSVYSGKNEGFVLKVRDAIIKEALEEGLNVVVDDTNFNPIHIENIKRIAEEYKAQVEIDNSFLAVSPEECIKRDLVRPNSVGSDVIWKMYYQYLKPEPVIQDEGLPSCYIFDLDGSLALHTSGRSPYDWSKVEEDSVNHELKYICNLLSNEHTIIILSGRDSVCLNDTKEWLEKNKIKYNYIFLRKVGDIRPDDIVKQELYENHIKNKYNVKIVFDDRDKVVNLWRRKLGLNCYQVNYGNF